MGLNELRRQFLEYLEIEKNRSPKTIENYDRYLRRFISLSGAGKPGEITLDSVRNYRLKLNRLGEREGAVLKKQTQFYHLIALRASIRRPGLVLLAAGARRASRHVESCVQSGGH